MHFKAFLAGFHYTEKLNSHPVISQSQTMTCADAWHSKHVSEMICNIVAISKGTTALTPLFEALCSTTSQQQLT